MSVIPDLERGPMPDSAMPTVAVPPPEEEECTTWVAPPRKTKKKTNANASSSSALSSGDSKNEPLLPATGATATEENPENSKKALCVSLATLLLSIPALIGAWCWPALVIGLVGGTVTASARSLGHTISFIITLVMMTGITAYMVYTSKRRRGAHLYKFGPTYLCLIASFLIMADPLRHVLQDADVWPSPSSGQYEPGCHDETMRCLSGVGWVFTVFCTYIGFTMLICGTMWNADLIGKLKAMRDKWRELRGTTQ